MQTASGAADFVTHGAALLVGIVVAVWRGARARALAFSVDAWAGLAIFVGAALLALQLFLVAARLDSVASTASDATLRAPWATVLVPLWIVYAALALALAAFLLTTSGDSGGSDEEVEEARAAGIKVLTALVVLSMFFASTVMLVEKLDGRRAHPYQAIAGPLYAAVGVFGAFGAYVLYHNYPETLEDDAPTPGFIV